MSLELRVARSVEEVGQEAWDRLAAGRPFSSYRWYRFGESVLRGDQPLYVIASQRGEPVARATFWVTRQEPVPIASRAVRGFVQALLERRPLMVCRSPLASTTGLILPDSSLRDEAVKAIVQAAQALAGQHRASFLLFDYLTEQEAGWSGWPKGFARSPVPDPGTRLVIAWPDFQEYMGHLSKSVRKDYRRHRNRAADLGIELRRHSSVVALEDALVLIRNVERHHNSTPNPRARTTLESAEMVNATWLTAQIEDCLVGCGLVLGDGDTRILALLGLDYSVRYAYFQLVYEAVRSVIEGGARVLRGGGGAYPMKERLGFELENDNFVVFAGVGSLLQRLGRWVASTAQHRGTSADGS